MASPKVGGSRSEVRQGQILSGIWLKSKVFLHQIGKKEFAEWAQHEVNG